MTSISQPLFPFKPVVLIMAGGTGGHVFPALAIAEALRHQNVTVYWLGTQRGLEARVVPAAGFDMHYISIQGLRGKGIFNALLMPFKLMRAVWQSLKVLRQCRPIAVVGMGGFVTGPGGIAAWLMHIPLLIHEQNAIAGLTNRWLGRLATQVLEAFPNTFPPSYHPIHTGNPLRKAIMTLTHTPASHTPLRVLIVGGSLGAKVLNETVPVALQHVKAPIAIWHQVGEAHIKTMQQAYKWRQQPVKLDAFIEEIAAAYAWADIVICRAGALTISELAQVGVASILIPYPHAVDDHQTRNAQFLVDQKAALLLPQTALTAEKLATILNELSANPKRLQAMSIAARQCAKPRALQKIVEIINGTLYPGNHIQEGV
jgi:UDP-N-acetylglucosamine--N-acetylmuramyl-(pentapeptide) pyrophosphoryl-undecaprenol N-acetylglucosamine transferase